MNRPNICLNKKIKELFENVCSGHDYRAIHIPDCQPNMNMDETEYRNNKGTTINHFYEKPGNGMDICMGF